MSIFRTCNTFSKIFAKSVLNCAYPHISLNRRTTLQNVNDPVLLSFRQTAPRPTSDITPHRYLRGLLVAYLRGATPDFGPCATRDKITPLTDIIEGHIGTHVPWRCLADSDAEGLPGLTPGRLFGFLLEKIKGTLTFPAQKSLSYF